MKRPNRKQRKRWQRLLKLLTKPTPSQSLGIRLDDLPLEKFGG
jgi:hypothetical protein